MFLNQGIVEKYHASPEAARYEANMLDKLHKKGLAVPRLISLEDNLVKMEYISGITLPDLIDKWEAEAPDPAAISHVAESIILWLADFYAAADTAKTGRGDINGRNFIFDGQKIWGVDFEEHRRVSRERDIARLIAHILTYRPAHTPLKESLARRILCRAGKILEINLEITEQQLHHEIEEVLALHRARQSKKERLT